MSDDPAALIAAALAAAIAAAALMAALSKNPVRGFYLYVFCAAILLSPRLPVVREKLTVCEPVFACTALALLLFAGRIRRSPVPLLPVQRAALAGAGLWLVSVFLSLAVNYAGGQIRDVQRSLLEAATYAYGFAVCAGFVLYVDTWAKWRNCLLAWTLGAGVVTAVGLMAMTVYAPGWTKDEFSGRISSTQRESNQLASYVGPLLPVAAFVLRKPGRSRLWASLPVRLAGFAGLAGAFVVMLGTGSRTAFLINGMAFCALMILLFRVAPRERVRAGLTRLIAVGGIVGMGLFVYGVATDTGETYQSGRTKPWERSTRIFAEILRGERSATDTRVEHYERLGRTWTDNPVLGAGPGNYGRLTRGHEIHNSYANVLGEQGLIGLFAFGLWFLLMFRAALTAARLAPRGEVRVIVLGFLAGCVLLALYQLTTLGLRQRPLWFASGLLICLPRVLLDLRYRSAHAARPAADGGGGRGAAGRGGRGAR